MDHPQPGFIGRANQIQIFEDLLLYEGDKRWILNVYGSGGMGKTALLRYYQILCDQHGTPHGPLIDFYELAYHSPRRMLQDIARALSAHHPEYFASFFDAITRTPATPSVDVAEKYLTEIVQLFKNGLIRSAQATMAAQKLKTVLFFDTYEQVPRSLRTWLTEELLRDLPGVVVVIAGRDRLGMRPEREDEFHRCLLDTFTLDEAKDFFAASQLPMAINEHQVADLWSLANGTPILLALSADWLQHDVSPEELSRISRDQFARSLVQRFADLGELANAAILYMAHLYHRFNEEIFCKVHQGDALNVPTAHKILEQLRSFQFIKYRPSGNYQLHDHARRLVCDYLLSDEAGLTLRLQLSRNVLAHYYQSQIPMDPMVQAEQLYHELFIDSHYQQYCDLFPADSRSAQRGYRLFEEAFDAAINRNDKIEICDLLLSIVEHDDFEGKFADQAGTVIKRARLWLRDPARREEACKLLASILDVPDASSIQRVEALLSLGRYAVPESARMYQAQARQEIQQLIDAQPVQRARPQVPAREAKPKETPVMQRAHAWQLVAYLETNLGLTCRRQGHWDEAVEHYHRALDALYGLPNNLPKRRQMAAVHNNLAFVYRQRGDLYKAEIFCRLSLAARQEMQETGQIAYSYHTLGEIYLDMRRYADAKSCLLKSLAAFRQVGDMRNAGMVFVDLATLARWRGASDLTDYYYGQATSLFKTWEVPEGMIDILNERACELHRRGVEQAEVSDFESAREYYQQAENLLRESLKRLSGSDRHYRQAYAQSKLCMVLQSRSRLVSDASERERCQTEILSLADQVENYADTHHYTLFTGEAEIIRGQVAFEQAGELRPRATASEVELEQSTRKLEMAFIHFARACAILAEFYQSPSEKFRRGFDQVIDCLLHPDLSPSEVDMACSIILHYFERESRDQAAAVFLENCRRIRQARGTGSERDGIS